MDLFSLIWIVVLVLVVIFFSRILHVILKIAAFAIVAILVMVIFFGVSLGQIVDWVMGVLLYVL